MGAFTSGNDAVDGSSTGTSVPWMWALLRLPRFEGASHADDNDNRFRHRQVGFVECESLVGTRSAEGIMASGHVNRIKRPNTWLHRPILQNVKKALANPEPSTHGTFQ